MSIAQKAAELLEWLDKRAVRKEQGATLSRMHVRPLYSALGPIWVNGLNGIGGALTTDQHDGLQVLNDMLNIGDNPVELIEFAKGEYCPVIDGDLEHDSDVYATLLVALKLIANQPEAAATILDDDDSHVIEAKYRAGGTDDGEPLTAAFIKQVFGIDGRSLRDFVADKIDDPRLTKRLLYGWKSLCQYAKDRKKLPKDIAKIYRECLSCNRQVGD